MDEAAGFKQTFSGWIRANNDSRERENDGQVQAKVKADGVDDVNSKHSFRFYVVSPETQPTFWAARSL